MFKMLGTFWEVVSKWLGDLGSAYVVDDGLGRSEKPRLKHAEEPNRVPRARI